MRRLLTLLLLIAPVSASLVIAQGDIVYMNETLDITQAVSWPDYQLAWCAVKNYDCDPPDQIIDAEKYTLDNFRIDDQFRYGTYYRWDGEWHPAENAVAFTVIPGKRPKTPKAPNATDAPAQIKQDPEGPFNYLVARGDTAILSTRIYEADSCQLWLFTNTADTYDIPMLRENGVETATLNSTITYSLNAGKYFGYIQCNGKNNWQDIFYTDEVFDTPYDNKKVPDVPVAMWNLLNAKRQFDDLTKTIPRFDDVLIPVTIEVVDPTTTITDVQQDESNLYISGVTTWSNNTEITIHLDPDQYPLQRDLMFHTWQTFATGSIDAPRRFNTALPFDKEDLFIGTHEITMKVDKNANTAVSSYAFKVSDIYVMPTPTPSTKRMIYGKDWESIPVKIEPTPEITPNETENDWEEFVYINPEDNVTANITTVETTVIKTTVAPTEVPIAKETIPTIPVSAPTILAAVGVSVVMWRRL